MFHTLTNVQRGEAVDLQQYIDNCCGDLRVGLRSITYTVGWYNVSAGESVSWRQKEEALSPSRTFPHYSVGESVSWRPEGGGAVTKQDIPPGIYNFTQLQDLRNVSNVTLEVSKVNGLITATVASGWEVLLTDGLLSLLGLDDGLGGQWLDAGTYEGDRPINFASTKTLYLYLEQINTTDNYVDGAPSTLLATVGLGCHSFGDIATVRVGRPDFKCLRGDTVGELKVVIKDDTGRPLDNHNLPITVVLEGIIVGL